jgi:formylglycine-generating enzyme required for sulfatase activity
MPVGFLSYYDALRFANWMNNGQGSGDTETGAYTLTGGTAIPANGETVTRNPGAQIVLSNENEWYKAAYYDSSTASYFTFPTGSNTEPVCSGPTGTANRANCQYAAGDLTAVGSYTGSPSPYGTFDQGGNGYEWNEAMIPCNLSGPCFDVYRGVRGGGLDGGSQSLAATIRSEANPANEGRTFGLRLVMIPEPSTGLLVTFGLLGLGARRRISA